MVKSSEYQATGGLYPAYQLNNDICFGAQPFSICSQKAAVNPRESGLLRMPSGDTRQLQMGTDPPVKVFPLLDEDFRNLGSDSARP